MKKENKDKSEREQMSEKKIDSKGVEGERDVGKKKSVIWKVIFVCAWNFVS